MATALEMMKALLAISDTSQDTICSIYLEDSANLICDIRNSSTVEDRYLITQVKIAIELYNKQGVEGQLMHSENGITRTYEHSGISKSLLDEIIPFVKTPFSERRVI